MGYAQVNVKKHARQTNIHVEKNAILYSSTVSCLSHAVVDNHVYKKIDLK